MIDCMYGLHAFIYYYTVHIPLLYCSYYTYACYCYVWAPPLRCYARSQPFAHHISILRPHSDTHEAFISQICHQTGHSLLRSIVFHCIGICIMHGVARELIQTHNHLHEYLWGSSSNMYPHMVFIIVRSAALISTTLFFIMGICVQGISWDPDLGLMIRDLF